MQGAPGRVDLLLSMNSENAVSLAGIEDDARVQS
jgi:hypothetical protein